MKLVKYILFFVGVICSCSAAFTPSSASSAVMVNSSNAIVYPSTISSASFANLNAATISSTWISSSNFTVSGGLSVLSVSGSTISTNYLNSSESSLLNLSVSGIFSAVNGTFSGDVRSSVLTSSTISSVVFSATTASVGTISAGNEYNEFYVLSAGGISNYEDGYSTVSITPTGITTSISGDTTFAINAYTGDATISGKLTASDFGGDAFANALMSGRYSIVNVQTGTETISNSYIGNYNQGKLLVVSASSTLANRFSFAIASPMGRFGGIYTRRMDGTFSGAVYCSSNIIDVKTTSATTLLIGMGTATASFDSSLTARRAVYASITQSGTTTMTAQLFCTVLENGALTYKTCSEPVSFSCVTYPSLTTQKIAFRTRTENGTSTAYLLYGYSSSAPIVVLSGSYTAWNVYTDGGYFIGLHRAGDTATEDGKLSVMDCFIIDER